MPSGKGEKCPNCGEQKYRPAGAVRWCSNCGATGFRGGEFGSPGGGHDRRCHLCEENTTQELATLKQGGVLCHCYGCSSTFVTAARKR